MIKLLLAGGPFMFATLAVSILTLAIFFWRLVFFLGKSSSSKYMLNTVVEMVESQKISKAIQTLSANTSPLAQLLSAALMRANRPEKEIRRAVEVTALKELPRVKAGTVYLPQLSNLATLLGLIGTIHGLIIAFQGAGSESVGTRQMYLSQGIAIAFYNTFFGLVTATMGIICYLILLPRMNAAMSLMEHSAAKVVDTILSVRDRMRKSA
ncbi:MAG: MotA/TolQ/ExbB proton channel family protein [Deltaproteobacteria bacterium]|nr:MotA/TolQ/ExbB proton channel family protein [Deltaproteobacteria bacterium]